MALLLDEDYEILESSGLEYEEDESNRYLILTNFPLKDGLYVHDGDPLTEVEVLVEIPPNYNTQGNNMFWTYPVLKRADGKAIPRASDVNGTDPRHYDGKEYCRWSRHWNKPKSWKPKEDNIQKIIDRITWALTKPDANQ